MSESLPLYRHLELFASSFLGCKAARKTMRPVANLASISRASVYVPPARQEANSLAPLSPPCTLKATPLAHHRRLLKGGGEKRAYSATLAENSQLIPTSICCAPLNLIQVLKTPVTAAPALQAAKSQPRGKKSR